MADNTSTTSVPTSALASLAINTNVPKAEGILKTPADQKPLVDTEAIKKIEEREAVTNAAMDDEDGVAIDEDDKFSHYSKSPTLSARRTSFGGASVGTAGDQDEESEDDFEIPSLDAEDGPEHEEITLNSKRKSVTFTETPEVIEDVAAEQAAEQEADENNEDVSDEDESEPKSAVKAE